MGEFLEGGLNGERPELRPGVPGVERADAGGPRADARPGVVGGRRSDTPVALMEPNDFAGAGAEAAAGALA